MCTNFYSMHLQTEFLSHAKIKSACKFMNIKKSEKNTLSKMSFANCKSEAH